MVNKKDVDTSVVNGIFDKIINHHKSNGRRFEYRKEYNMYKRGKEAVCHSGTLHLSVSSHEFNKNAQISDTFIIKTKEDGSYDIIEQTNKNFDDKIKSRTQFSNESDLKSFVEIYNNDKNKADLVALSGVKSTNDHEVFMRDSSKAQAVKGILVYYMNVGYISPEKSEKFMQTVMKRFGRVSKDAAWKIPDDVGIVFIPIREAQTHVEYISFGATNNKLDEEYKKALLSAVKTKVIVEITDDPDNKDL